MCTCPRPAPGKARKKSGTGLASRKLSFFLVTSACVVWFLFCLVFLFSGKFVFLETRFQFTDVDILGIFRSWHKWGLVAAVTNVAEASAVAICQTRWQIPDFSDPSCGIQWPPDPRETELTESGGASSYILVSVMIWLKYPGKNNK